MKIYDTTLLGSGPQDLDLLECRLYELGDDDPFHAHVIVEGGITFTGLPKPLYYQENKDRFARWADRIRYLPIMPTAQVPGKQPGEAWAREHCSRQACMLGLWDAAPDDLIVHGDIDEILTADAAAALPELPDIALPCKLRLRHFSFAVDWEQPKPWWAPSVARFGQVQSFTDLRENGWPTWEFTLGAPAGWHLSWMGGRDAMEVKLHSFSHVERVSEIEAGIAAGKYLEGGLFWREPGEDGGDYHLLPVDVDESWPQWVVDGLCPKSWFRPRAHRATLELESADPMFGPDDPRSRPAGRGAL